MGPLEQSVLGSAPVAGREQGAQLPQGWSGFLWPNVGLCVDLQATSRPFAPSSSRASAFALLLLRYCQK